MANGNVVVGRNFTATITRVNGHGFQTDAYPGEWLNLSKFASPPPTIPEPGTVVEVTLDGSGFVRAIVPSGAAQPALPLVPAPSTLSRSITRLAVLKSATRFLAGQPDATTDELLELAARLEAWVERDI